MVTYHNDRFYRFGIVNNEIKGSFSINGVECKLQPLNEFIPFVQNNQNEIALITISLNEYHEDQCYFYNDKNVIFIKVYSCDNYHNNKTFVNIVDFKTFMSHVENGWTINTAKAMVAVDNVLLHKQEHIEYLRSLQSSLLPKIVYAIVIQEKQRMTFAKRHSNMDIYELEVFLKKNQTTISKVNIEYKETIYSKNTMNYVCYFNHAQDGSVSHIDICKTNNKYDDTNIIYQKTDTLLYRNLFFTIGNY